MFSFTYLAISVEAPRASPEQPSFISKCDRTLPRIEGIKLYQGGISPPLLQISHDGIRCISKRVGGENQLQDAEQETGFRLVTAPFITEISSRKYLPFSCTMRMILVSRAFSGT